MPTILRASENGFVSSLCWPLKNVSYRVYFTQLADADIDAIIGCIAQDSPENALNLVTQLQERIKKR